MTYIPTAADLASWQALWADRDTAVFAALPVLLDEVARLRALATRYADELFHHDHYAASQRHRREQGWMGAEADHAARLKEINGG